MAPRIFSLNEARSLLSSLRSDLLELQSLKIELQSEWDKLEDRLGGDKSEIILARAALRSSRVLELSNEYNALFSHVEKTGVVVRSVEQGLIDFPYIVSGQLVFLCWQLDEPTISWWHEPNTGFSGRKLLVDVPHYEAESGSAVLH